MFRQELVVVVKQVQLVVGDALEGDLHGDVVHGLEVTSADVYYNYFWIIL